MTKINLEKTMEASRAWGTALNDLHDRQMVVAEAEQAAASYLAALEAGRKMVAALLEMWAAAEARAEAARQALTK